jgi:hypothetical protein
LALDPEDALAGQVRWSSRHAVQSRPWHSAHSEEASVLMRGKAPCGVYLTSPSLCSG